MKVKVPFKLDPRWLSLLDAKIKRLGHTRSSYIRWLVEKDLREKK